MMIIIEGPDGAGKTTLANEFVKLGFEYRHEGVPKPGTDMFEWYTQQLLSVELGQNVVFDRLLLSEWVYGHVVRERSAITFHQLRLLLRLFYASAGVMIMCSTDEDVIIDNWRKRKGVEYVQQEAQLKAINTRYNSLFTELSPDLEIYNIKLWAPIEFAAIVRNRYAPIFYRLGGVLGRPKPAYQIVGERSLEERDLVFYSDNKSAGFLSECLWDAGYKESELSFINAQDHDGMPNDIFYPWRELKRPVVIALGKIAEQTCINQGVPHLALSHPQYVKRFKSKKRVEYVRWFRIFHRNF